MGSEGNSAVQSIDNAFAILDALQALDGAGVTDLSEHLDLPKSTVHNYLSTLEGAEFVVKDGRTYHVGLRFLEYGAFARDRYEIYQVAKPELEALASETGELANLAVEEHGRGCYLYRTHGQMAVGVREHVGTRASLHSTALGKAMLAHLPEARVREIVDEHGLEPETDRTITNLEELLAELETVRSNGVAYDDEERLDGLRCVAAPILRGDDVLGAISVAGPTTRVRGDRFREKLPRRLRETKKVIELEVTYS